MNTHLTESTIVVEYSLAQKAFHKYPLREMIVNNLANVINRKQTDYVPIGIFRTENDADIFIANNSRQLTDYSLYKSFAGETLTVEY